MNTIGSLFAAMTMMVIATSATARSDPPGSLMMAQAAVETPAKPEVTTGALTITGGRVKAMLPGAEVGSGGLSIRNGGPADDRLLSISSPAAGRVEIHDMVMQGDVMRMRRVEGGLVLPAGQTVALDGSTLHLMFFGIGVPFATGGSVPVTLTFEKAGTVDYMLPVTSASGE